MNKRGLSNVIVAVLLILVTIAAVVIIWGFIRNSIIDRGVEIETGFSIHSFSIPRESVTIDEDNTNLSLIVKRNSGDREIVAFSVVVYDESGKSQTHKQDYSLQLFESKKISLNYSGLENVNKIEIYPIFLNSRGDEVTGRESGSLIISDNVPPAPGATQSCTIDSNCNDNNICNGLEICSASGSCQSGTSLNCNDGNECTSDSCNAVSGCTNAPLNGISCGGGSGTCNNGVCSLPIPLDYISYWKFENNLLDEKGNGDGSTNGNIIYISGVDGKAARIAGGSNYMRIANPSTYNLQHITLSTWVTGASFSQPLSYLFGKNRDCCTDTGGYGFSITNTGKLRGDIWRGLTSGMLIAYGGTTINPNQFYHVAMTFDGTKIVLYVNGQVDGESTVILGDIIKPSSLELLLGSLGAYPGTYTIDGALDETLIYDRALSLEEIKSICDSQKGSPC